MRKASNLLPLALLFLGPAAGHGQPDTRAISPLLQRYANCKLAKGPEVVEVIRLPAAQTEREVDTVEGKRALKTLDGVKVTFAYPETESFATVKAEQLPAESYGDAKADLISEQAKILASDDNVSRNTKLKAGIHGFEVYGLDANKLERGVLGIYLVFDDATHVTATISFLNAETTHRKFDSLREYGALRDEFLESYMACLHGAS